MEARANRSRTSGEATGGDKSGAANDVPCRGTSTRLALNEGRIYQVPPAVLDSAVTRLDEYDARRLRSQREVIRDVMLAAADCDTWLTLGELRAVTRYGEASISAQLRHLRKLENGGYEVAKRHREGAIMAHSATDGRGECVWEYRVARVIADSHGGTFLQPRRNAD